MKFILEITIVFAMVVMGQGFVQKVNPCATVRCSAGTICVVKNGRAFCQPDFCSLPAETGLCKAYIPRYFYNTKTGKCEIFIYGGCGGNNNNFDTKKDCEAKCGVLPTLPALLPTSCAAVTCFKDHKCVVIDGRASCKPACKTSSDCKQQGSFCNTDSGICQCGRFCPLRVDIPVCGSDGKQYGSLCLLNASACDQGITIATVPC